MWTFGNNEDKLSLIIIKYSTQEDYNDELITFKFIIKERKQIGCINQQTN